MIKPKLHWKAFTGEGKVTFPIGFDDQEWTVKADALQDWIADLTDKYQSLLTKGEYLAEGEP